MQLLYNKLQTEKHNQTDIYFIIIYNIDNQYISASNASASYPKQIFRNHGEIKYYGEISIGQIPLTPVHHCSYFKQNNKIFY